MKVEEFTDPYLGKTWQELGARILASGNRISVTLGYPAHGLQAQLQQQLAEFLGVTEVERLQRAQPVERPRPATR